MFHRFATTILGNTYRSDEEPFHPIAPLPLPSWRAVTDKKGVARIPNLPTSMYCSYLIGHPDWELPIAKGTTMSIALNPGAETAATFTLQPKGKEFQGNPTRP
jgi:hypothetical protein